MVPTYQFIPPPASVVTIRQPPLGKTEMYFWSLQTHTTNAHIITNNTSLLAE